MEEQVNSGGQMKLEGNEPSPMYKKVVFPKEWGSGQSRGDWSFSEGEYYDSRAGCIRLSNNTGRMGDRG